MNDLTIPQAINRAQAAITTYLNTSGRSYENTADKETTLADVICDLQHWAVANDIDWLEALKRGAHYHEDELEDSNDAA